MNTPSSSENDPALRELLRSSHPAPELRAGFRSDVWRRIESGGEEESALGWITSLWRTLAMPRWAFAAMAMAMLGGAWFGTTVSSRQQAQERYVSLMAPWQQR